MDNAGAYSAELILEGPLGSWYQSSRAHDLCRKTFFILPTNSGNKPLSQGP